MTPQDQKLPYHQEIEEAIEALQNLAKNGFHNVAQIAWWLLRYEELYTYSYDHRHDESCVEGMGCGCASQTPESKFSDLYPALEEIADLHRYEMYFQKEMEVFEQVRDDQSGLMQWLKKNEKLGTENFFLFWTEWLEEEDQIVTPFLFNWQHLNMKFESREWQHTVNFLEIFNDVYWTSEACPSIEELKK